jgi:hypothetical protein
MTNRSRFDFSMHYEFEMSYREACDDECLLPPCVREALPLADVLTHDPLFEGLIDFHLGGRRR